MSLYDDILLPSSSEEAKLETPQAKPVNPNFLFLKQQLEARKAQAEQNKPKAKPTLAPKSTTIINPINVLPKPQNILKPRRAKALPLDQPSSFSILPKAVKEDKVFLFNEIHVEDEYNPTNPTDYSVYKPKRESQLAKERIAKEIADRLAKEHKDEEKKRQTGAAFAPPQVLLEQDAQKMAEPAPVPQRGVKRGLNIAASIMERMGYKEGQGLGKDEQGMSSALRVEKVGRIAGMIVDGNKKSWDRDEQGKYVTQRQPINVSELSRTATNFVQINNMVLPSDVDDGLRDEVFEEMKKYGQVMDVQIEMVPDVPESESVRIVVQFTNQAQAMKAVIDLNKRFFGGRPIHANFYDPLQLNLNQTLSA